MRFIDKTKLLIKKSIEINKILRDQYNKIYCEIEEIPCKPFGGSTSESIGPWPEIIYKGLKCPRSERGFCSPCGYSNIEKMSNKKNEIDESLLFQTKFILDLFDEFILKNQRRRRPYPNFDKKNPSGKDVMMALTTLGSFLCLRELNEITRVKILEMILSFIQKEKINIQIFFECHALDIIDFYEKGNYDKTLTILKELNAVIIVGLESVDAFNRNVLYCKSLRLEEFKKAVDIIKTKLGLVPGAFVFVGCHSMNEYEILNDVMRTISYLKELETMPVIMISNLKPYTMHHLLYSYNRYNLPDPRTILYIAKKLKTIAPNMSKTEDWLFADPRGGPPEPMINPFTNVLKTTCNECSRIIEQTIFGDYKVSEPNGLRETYDWEDFEEKIKPISNCNCKFAYEEYINKTKNENLPILNRAIRNINFAEKIVKNYYNEQER